MSKPQFNAGLLTFLHRAPTPFHAVAVMRERLLAAGFRELDEADSWQVAPRGHYFVTRNQSSLIAFRTGKRGLAEQGLRMVGAHTDSPCLKLKPNAVATRAPPDAARQGAMGWRMVRNDPSDGRLHSGRSGPRL